MLLNLRALMTAAVIITLLLHPSASAARRTRTEGLICRKEPCHFETFSGGYIFKGVTNPSRRGDTVVFSFKRVGRPGWTRLGKPGGNRPFFAVDGSATERINSDHRWKEHIDINGFMGYPHKAWILRATYVRQHQFARSSEWVRIEAAYGD